MKRKRLIVTFLPPWSTVGVRSVADYPLSRGRELSYRTGDILSPRVEPVERILWQMEDFCRAIRERVEPRSSAAIGLEVVQTIEQVDQLLATGGRPVTLASRVSRSRA